jgi:hypothetical protein
MEMQAGFEEGICVVSFGMSNIIYTMQYLSCMAILSDGGGPGTISQLLMIDEFMTRLAFELDKDHDELRPADYFDLMSGVGFGGQVPGSALGPHINIDMLDSPPFYWAAFV